jgi:hypothetical protein
MIRSWLTTPLGVLSLLAGFLFVPPSPLAAQEAASDTSQFFEEGWPRNLEAGADTFTVYQPQLDSWKGNRIEMHAAVAVRSGKESTVYGVVSMTATTLVDKSTQLVTLQDLVITRTRFPSAPDRESSIQETLQAKAAGKLDVMSLDRLGAMLGILGEMQTASHAVENTPPRFIFSETPALLVSVAGNPVWKPVPGVQDLQHVLNTQCLLVKEGTGALYLHVFDGWMTADGLEQTWTVATKTGEDLQSALEWARKQGDINLLEGDSTSTAGSDSTASAPPSLRKGPVPVIHVATEPTVLIVFQGTPDWVPQEGTDLLYAKNTSAYVFMELDNQNVYVLTAGRWFRAASLAGPWTYVPGKELPADFANIPDDSRKENAKASVPGTEAAKEALIVNSIPQTAEVQRSTKMNPPPTYDGTPELESIPDTGLDYVVNSAVPIISVAPDTFYAVQSGVWFISSSLNGPWEVATYVSPVVYSIPTSNPLHYVTYVEIYQSTPTTVVVGYTPGYMGTVVSDDVVVYGTGYAYQPWIGTVYYSPPLTYAYGAAMVYNPWGGWGFAFGVGMMFGAALHPFPYWGPYHYPHPYGAYYGPHGYRYAGYGGWGATTGNVYHQWGPHQAVTRSSGGYNAWTGNSWRGQSGTSYNSRTGVASAGQRGVATNAYTGGYAAGKRGTATDTRTGQTVSGGRATVGNAYTGRSTSAGWVSGSQGSAARVGNNVYADHDGNVYKNDPAGGWSKSNGLGGWSPESNPGTVHGLDQQAAARDFGGARAGGFRAAGGFGGGFRGGGGFRR